MLSENWSFISVWTYLYQHGVSYQCEHAVSISALTCFLPNSNTMMYQILFMIDLGYIQNIK
jgi:hypothetical protein